MFLGHAFIYCCLVHVCVVRRGFPLRNLLSVSLLVIHLLVFIHIKQCTKVWGFGDSMISSLLVFSLYFLLALTLCRISLFCRGDCLLCSKECLQAAKNKLLLPVNMKVI